ncbi:unnamed protein product, partial [marine sediment metagenome]
GAEGGKDVRKMVNSGMAGIDFRAQLEIPDRLGLSFSAPSAPGD